MITQND
jgi:centractin